MLARTNIPTASRAIYPPMMYVIMALDLLGYPKDHPDVKEAEKQFFNLLVDDERGFFFQPCFSVVWDTAIAAYAIGESGLAPDHALTRCADWLLTKEVRRKGDWAIKRPNVEPSGWYFEFANESYPDIDDTAQVLLALQHARAGKGHDACVRRAVSWLLAMQSKDGGWAAFDVDNNWHSLSAVPFADHNAMLDPTCPDITGRVLEGLIASGVKRDDPAIRRGVEYLIRTQEADGSWYGRWGVDYIYGTFLALRGLKPPARAIAKLTSCAPGNGSGRFKTRTAAGAKAAHLRSAHLRRGASSPSQTAWAILGLIAGGDTTSGSLQKGIEYLIETQRADGGWDEELSTGTGFPGVFYLNITCTAIRSRYWHCPVTCSRSEPNSITEHTVNYESSAFAGGRAWRPTSRRTSPRPSPEWQKNLAGRRCSNPFKIVHAQIPAVGHERKSHPDDQQAFPAGHDAGASARLQPHLHRLRTDSRIRIQHPRTPLAGTMPEGCRRVQCAHGFDLRRRAAALSRDRTAVSRQF